MNGGYIFISDRGYVILSFLRIKIILFLKYGQNFIIFTPTSDLI